MLKSNPKHADALFQQGSAKLDAGDYRGAEELFRSVLSERPNLIQAHNSLAVALLELGRPKEAEGHLRLAITLEPKYGLAHYNLGVALASLGRLVEATECYLRAVALIPRDSDVHQNLADLLRQQNNLDEALKHARRAVALKPGNAVARNTLGNILQDLMRFEEAMKSFRRAIALDPTFALAHNSLGASLIKLGRFDEARKALERALKLNPRTAIAYMNLGQCKKFVADDPHLKAMEELARDMESLSQTDQMRLHFALSRAYSDLRMHERAFEHLLRGNALKRQEITYDEQAKIEYFKRIQALFTADFIRHKQGMGSPSRVPIFILGMPRSGSTLVEQIIASHPKVHGAGELRYVRQIVRGEAEADRTHREYPEIVAEFGPERFLALGEKYLERVGGLSKSAERITDKMPENYEFVGLIHLAFPNATIIHTLRDPADTCVSCFSQIFQHHTQSFSYDLGELGRYYRMYRALMDHWKVVLPEGRMLEVQYEGLVDDLEGEARRIIAQCGLGWDDACLSFHTTERAVLTASAAQVRQPIYQSSVGRWTVYKAFLGPLLDALQLD